MRYLGGKEQIADWVASHVWSLRGTRTKYLEPFVGSAAVFRRLAPHFIHAVGADAHEDLILMWQALQKGWRPPSFVSKEEWERLKGEPPSPLRGFAGFGGSFGGKWFGGYGTQWDRRKCKSVSTIAETARALVKAASSIARASFIHADYASHTPYSNAVVYCDPPYAGTTGYRASASALADRNTTIPFDHPTFWKTATSWADQGAVVVVSEESAPEGWKVLAETS